MKKQLSLIMAGGLLAFASCNSGTTPESGASQATIDSAVNARVEEIRLQMMAQNDSLINALAQWKADSIIAAMKGEAPKAKKPVAKKSTKAADLTTNGSTNTGSMSSGEATTPSSSSKWNQGDQGTNSKTKWNNQGENKTEPTSTSKWKK